MVMACFEVPVLFQYFSFLLSKYHCGVISNTAGFGITIIEPSSSITKELVIHALPFGVECPDCELHHSSQSRAKIQYPWRFMSFPLYSFMCGTYLLFSEFA
jgi:hypothetical protein